MNTRTRIPPPSQRQQLLEQQRRRYEQRQREIKSRKRKMLIKRIAVFVLIAVIAILLVWMVMSFIDNNSGEKPRENNSGTNQESSTGENAESVIDDEHGEGFNLASLIDPSTLNPNDKIDLYYHADQVLPKVYYTDDTPYTTFAEDNPSLGSNTDTRVIVIDAGHQTETRKSNVWLSPYLDPSKDSSWVKNSLLTIGTDGSKTKIPEYKTTHVIAGKLKTALEALGYTVYLSHPDIEEQLSGSQRAMVANKNNADLMISLHCNSYDEDPRQSGAMALIPKIWEGYPSERLAYLSRHAATVILEEYSKATELKNRGLDPIPKTSMFSFCKVPIVLLEMGFSSCPSDDKAMNDPEFQEKIVSGIVAGINKYFSLIEIPNNE